MVLNILTPLKDKHVLENEKWEVRQSTGMYKARWVTV